MGGQTAIKNPRRIFSQLGGDASLPDRVTTLENNEYKITYYEIISGASGSLTLPTGAIINAGEFGESGNAILSKIDGSSKPTYLSPKTVGGVVVTASLNVSTGAWTASGTYTDASVALIYSIKIKAIYYSNLAYSRIIDSVQLTDFPIVQVITDGDTTHSPSGDAVFDSLALKLTATSGAFTKSHIKQNTTIAHTGTTAETKVYSVLIPAGTMTANDIFRIAAKIYSGAGGGNKTARWYFNTSDAIGGVQVASYVGVGALTQMVRNVIFKNSLSSQEVFLPATSHGNDESLSTNSSQQSLLAADFASDVWFVVSFQLATGTDTLNLHSITSQISR